MGKKRKETELYSFIPSLSTPTWGSRLVTLGNIPAAYTWLGQQGCSATVRVRKLSALVGPGRGRSLALAGLLVDEVGWSGGQGFPAPRVRSFLSRPQLMPPEVSSELRTVFRAWRKNVTVEALGPLDRWRRPQAPFWERGLGVTPATSIQECAGVASSSSDITTLGRG